MKKMSILRNGSILSAKKLKEAVALKLTAKEEAEEDDEHSEEWLNIFSQEAEKTATGSLQQKKEKRQTTFVLLICGNRLKPWKKG
jgi:hypothetical protein